jgi:hypothetical protein
VFFVVSISGTTKVEESAFTTLRITIGIAIRECISQSTADGLLLQRAADARKSHDIADCPAENFRSLSKVIATDSGKVAVCNLFNSYTHPNMIREIAQYAIMCAHNAGSALLS